SYLSAFFSFSVGKIFKDFEKEDNSTDCDKEKVKKLHFINLFISSFLRLFIVLSTIVVVILIWTLPEGILSDILLRFNLIPSEIFKLFIAKVIYLALTLTIGAIVIYISKIIGNNIYRFIEDSDASELNEKEARAKTLINVTHNIVKVVVFIFIIFSFLQNIGINIAALLAGAGIMGIAVGFGAQSLIKDFFSGFFILFENQYAVGDVVKIGDVSGSVEKITLRITVLRNLEGVVHIIPNGHIASVSNMTQGLSRSVIDIDVAYEENLERVFKVLNELSEEFYNDENWKPHIIKKPEILGVDRIAEYSVVVRFLTTTKPLKRWDVTRELNKRIKNKFDEVGIVIPYPHMKIIR
nr:mechanosensitive ion channel family protein [Spirochaetota bacterium]